MDSSSLRSAWPGLALISIHRDLQTTLDRWPRLHSRAQPYWRQLRMRRKPKKRKIGKPKARLRLPVFDQSKAAVVGSLRSPESQRGYIALDESSNGIVRNRASRSIGTVGS